MTFLAILFAKFESYRETLEVCQKARAVLQVLSELHRFQTCDYELFESNDNHTQERA